MKNYPFKQRRISAEKPDKLDDETERVFARLKVLSDRKGSEKEKKQLIIKRYRKLRKFQRQRDLLYASSPFTRKFKGVFVRWKRNT